MGSPSRGSVGLGYGDREGAAEPLGGIPIGRRRKRDDNMKPLAAGSTAERGKPQLLKPATDIVSGLDDFIERDGFARVEIENQ